MSTATAATAPAAEAPAGAAPPKKGKVKLFALAGLLVAVAAGAATWHFVLDKPADDGSAPVAAKKKAGKPLFTTLEPFTVNLQDPRGERFAQIGITLQFEDPKLEMDIKDRLPAVRNEILLLISSKQIEELLSTEGKQRLAEEIRGRAARAIGLEPAAAAPGKPATPNPIQGVLFSQFIVQ